MYLLRQEGWLNEYDMDFVSTSSVVRGVNSCITEILKCYCEQLDLLCMQPELRSCAQSEVGDGAKELNRAAWIGAPGCDPRSEAANCELQCPAST